MGRVKTSKAIEINKNNPICNRNRIGESNNSVNPDMNIISNDETANQIVIRLNALTNSIIVNRTVNESQNHGENINL
jgi:hypothetical protein